MRASIKLGVASPAKSEHGKQIITEAILVGGDVNPDWHGNHIGEEEGDQGEQYGVRKTFPQQLAYGLVPFEGPAHFSAQKAPKPAYVLLYRRGVKAVFLLERFDFSLVDDVALLFQAGDVACEKVAWRQLNDDEHNYAQEQESDNRVDQSLRDIADHFLAS